MRWERLFADLESSEEARRRLEDDAEAAARAREEFSRVHYVDRLRAHDGYVDLVLDGGRHVLGDLVDVGRDWVRVRETVGATTVVPLAAVMHVGGIGRAVAPATDLEARLSLGHALRELVRDRAAVRVEMRHGGVLEGTIDVAGADFLEVAMHPADEPRRRANVSTTRVVPYSALVCVSVSSSWPA